MPCCPPLVCVDATPDGGFNDAAAANAELRYGQDNVIRVGSIADLVNQLGDRQRRNPCCLCQVMIVGHGTPGEISVGDDQGTQPNQRIRVGDPLIATLLLKLRPMFCTVAQRAECADCVPELVLWGCNVGAEADGVALLAALAAALEVPVSAETGVVYDNLWPHWGSRRVRVTPGAPSPEPVSAPETQPPLRHWPPGNPFSSPSEDDRDRTRSKYPYPPPPVPDPLPPGPLPAPDADPERGRPSRPRPPPPRRWRRMRKSYQPLKALRDARPDALLLWPGGFPLPERAGDVDGRLLVCGKARLRELLRGIDVAHGQDLRGAGHGWEGWILPVRDGKVLRDAALVVTGDCRLIGGPARRDEFLELTPLAGWTLRQSFRLGRVLLQAPSCSD